MNNLMWGLQISVLGMGLVFALLALLWGLLTLVQRFDRPPAAVVVVPKQGASAEASEPVAIGPTQVHGIDAELIAAIVVATLAHRAVRRREAAPAMRMYWPGSLLYASRWVGAGRARQNHSWQRRGR